MKPPPSVINPTPTSIVRIFLNGYTDLVWRTANGKWFLLDYKFARNENGKILDYSLQILCYALALREAVAPPDLEAYLVFLQEDPTAYVRVPADDSKIEEFSDRVRSIAVGIAQKLVQQDESVWDRTTPEKCRAISCEYLERCWEVEC